MPNCLAKAEEPDAADKEPNSKTLDFPKMVDAPTTAVAKPAITLQAFIARPTSRPVPVLSADLGGAHEFAQT